MLLWRTFSDLTPVVVDVVRFELGHHAGGCRRGAASASSRSARKPGRTKPPSRFRCGGSSTRPRASIAGQLAARPRSGAPRCARCSVRQARCRRLAPSSAAVALRAAREPVADRREIARAAASERQPRDRARDVRRPLAGLAQVARAAPRRRRSSCTASRRARWLRGSRSGDASRAASSRAPAPVTVRSMADEQAALLLAGRRAHQFKAGPARGIDHRATPSAPVLRGGRTHRLLADLRQIDVAQQRADRGQLGAREAAEGRRDRRRRAAPSESRSPARLSNEAAGTGVARRAGTLDPAP